MASPTMEPIAVIRKHLEDAEPDLLRDLLQSVIEALMGVEVESLAGAGYRERSDRRQPPQRLSQPALGHPRRHDRSCDP